MVKLKLTIAFDKYDYLQPLREGLVEAEGIDLNLLTVESGIRHERMFHYGEYDACEFSMSSYLVARGQDVDWLQAIPFFPRRMWGHKFCFIKAGSGIKKPADLKGGRIGLRSYENTLALVTKGMLMNSYDLGVSDVTWVIVNKETVGPKLPPNIKVEFVEGKRKLEDLLVEGTVDAEVEPDLPQRWLRGEGSVERLFPDFEKEEKAYYQRTKVFPIMHPIVIKKEILDRDPWVATSLYEALIAVAQSVQRFHGATAPFEFRLGPLLSRSGKEILRQRPVLPRTQRKLQRRGEFDQVRRPARHARAQAERRGIVH